MSVNVGLVATFPGAKADKAQALKVLEEAAEVFGAWQSLEGLKGTRHEESRRVELMDECCDVMQAACNMLAALGVTDWSEAVAAEKLGLGLRQAARKQRSARANTVRTVDVNRLRAIAHGLRHIGREGFNGYDINEEDKKLLADYADGILRAIGEEK